MSSIPAPVGIPWGVIEPEPGFVEIKSAGKKRPKLPIDVMLRAREVLDKRTRTFTRLFGSNESSPVRAATVPSHAPNVCAVSTSR